MSSNSSTGGGAADPEKYGPQAGIISPMPLVERGVAGILSCSPDGQFVAYANGPNVIVRSLVVRLKPISMKGGTRLLQLGGLWWH